MTFEEWWNDNYAGCPQPQKFVAEDAWQAATIAERERCAMLCDEYKGRVNGIAENIAMKIRGE